MRGSDERSGSLFSYAGFWRRAFGRIIRCGRSSADRERGPGLDLGRASLQPSIRRVWVDRQSRRSDCMRAMLLQAQLRHPPRAPAYGSGWSSRSLFRWFRGPGSGRSGMGPFELLEEPRPAAGGRDRGEVPKPRCWPSRRWQRLLSSDHFSVDGTLLEAWASIKSFRAQGRGRQRQHWAGPQRRAPLP